MALGREIGGPQKAKDMMSGKGVSLILKSVSLNYKRPVTYPDTVRLPQTSLSRRFSDTTTITTPASDRAQTPCRTRGRQYSVRVQSNYILICPTEGRHHVGLDARLV